MAKVDVLDILRVKQSTPQELDFDAMQIPPLHYFLSQQDVDRLRSIATSLKLSSKIKEKYRLIDEVMRPRGFKRFSAGTNRIVYSFYEDDRFVVKIAVDRVGMKDNPMEYQNQFLLKPYVSKMFYVSPCGTVGFAERVLPIKNRAEFKEIASDVFDILVYKILGKYVVEDIGTEYFMNYGIRRDGIYGGGGPVLLDYPYVYKLDGGKLFCTKTDPVTGIMCNGEIDYDAGFNHLVCMQCGKIYLATNLQDETIDNRIIIKGGNQMKVLVEENGKIVDTSIPTDEVMRKPKTTKSRTKGLAVVVDEGNKPSVEKEVVPSEPVITEKEEAVESKIEILDEPKGQTKDEEIIPEIESEEVDPDADGDVDDPWESGDTASSEPEGILEPEKAEEGDLEGDQNGGGDVEEASKPDSNGSDSENGSDSVSEGSNNVERVTPVSTVAPSRPRDNAGRFISTKSGSTAKKKVTPSVSSSFIPSSNEVKSNG